MDFRVLWKVRRELEGTRSGLSRGGGKRGHVEIMCGSMAACEEALSNFWDTESRSRGSM